MDAEAPLPIKEIITRFLEGHASEEEIAQLHEWVKQDDANRQYFYEINDAYQASITLPRYNQPKINTAWDQLSKGLNTPGLVQHPAVPKSNRYTFLLKVAASITLLALTGLAIILLLRDFTAAPSVVYNAGGNSMRIRLPDSSFVWLNRNSTLEYAASFGAEHREVLLTGEAFFDVRKNNHPFVVKTNHIQVHVKGTKFNVKAYATDAATKTTLAEGKIELLIDGNQSRYVMHPGDQITLDSDHNKVVRKKVNPANFSAWKEEQLTFDGTPLRDIILQLESRFNVNIVPDANVSLNERLSITVEDETLDEVLDLIQQVSRVKVHKDKNTIVLTQ
ncbi:FecR family protein [Chryseolinea lacunae]|uniref:FecR domain-containing protein n=1 Tax=Chryseolinea lacunae TaxID=2801331 RepID=A0ABS1KJP5_9BACT|nr:FecR domain-containing protein [Chryseolinea lacunae]MBL0739681.1 FecR domain-containing protein [Chryseolinea lacunae]